MVRLSSGISSNGACTFSIGGRTTRLHLKLPDDLLIALGDVIVAAGLVERQTIAILGDVLIPNDRLVIEAVTAGMDFRRLMEMAISATRWKAPAHLDSLGMLSKRVYAAYDKRNEVVHGAWNTNATGPGGEFYVQRFVRRGERFIDTPAFTTASLNQLAEEFYALEEELRAWRANLQ